MVLITFNELIDLTIMVFAIGFIFSKLFRKPAPIKDYDPIKHYTNKNNVWEDLKWGIIVAAPAVVLHEFAHKFVAMSFGAQAFLQAPVMWYAFVILLIALKSPIVFFVGGYVTHTPLPLLQGALVSVSGPLTNLILWTIFHFSMQTKSKFVKRNIQTFAMMKKINMFLFIFNMLPIPGFDGFNFFSSLFRFFF